MNTNALVGSNKLYPLQCEEAVNYVVGRSGQGEQVIMGLPGPFLAAVFFDENGGFVKHEIRHPAPAAQPPGIPSARQAHVQPLTRMWEVLEDWKREIGFTSSKIEIIKFYLTDIDAGILDLPGHLQDIADAPPETDDQLECAEELQLWRQLGKFVLRWGGEYWLDSSGRVTDT
jgi:hypothetical protein